jgi:hypothetical protein
MAWASCVLGALVAADVACNAIIGTPDLVYEPDAAEGRTVQGDAFAPGSDGSTADAPGSSGDSGTCGDVQTSSKNCGRCGHDCLGGSCSAGQCLPVALKAGGSPRVVRLDAKHVYWSDSKNARVGQMDKDGSNPLDLALAGTNNDFPIGLTVDGANLYWGGIENVLFRCKIGGCANSPTQVATTNLFTDLLVEPSKSKVFWIDGSGPTKVMSVSASANNANGSQVISTSSSLSRLASDGTSLYVTSDDRTIRRIDIASNAVATVATGTNSALGIAVDQANVYWTDGDDPATIDSAPKNATGGTATALAANQHHPIAIAVDPVHIYWANGYIGLGDGTGSIMTCAFVGCTPVVLADKVRTPVSIAVDDTAIYWAAFDDGNDQGGVYKLAKP